MGEVTSDDRGRSPDDRATETAQSERREARRQRRLVIAMAAVAGALSIALAVLRILS